MFSKKATKNYPIFTVDLTLTKLTSKIWQWRFRNFLWPSYKTWTLTDEAMDIFETKVSSLPLNYVKAKLSNSDISFLCHKQGHFWHVQRPTMGWNAFSKVNGSYLFFKSICCEKSCENVDVVWQTLFVDSDQYHTEKSQFGHPKWKF